jgi:serine/threonine-protein kinase
VPPPRLRLLSRVALALAAVGLLPLAVSTFGLVDVNREALEEQVWRTQTVATRTAAARLEAELDTWTSLARGTASHPALADPHSAAAGALLSSQLQSWADLGALAVALVNERGEEVVRAQVKGAQQRAGLAEALHGDGGPPLLAVPAPGGPLVRIDVRLASGAGLLRLVCDGRLLADGLPAWELGEQASLVVVDRSGRALLGAPEGVRSLPRGWIDGALSGRMVGVTRFRDAAGRTMLSAAAPVGAGEWTVLSWQPASAADHLAARVRRRSLLAVGASLGLIALLSAWAYRGVVRPLRRLVADQRGLAHSPAGGGGDEIEDLQDSFESLRRSLAEREALDHVFLGRYQVVEHLGTGAMGSVFRGWDPKLQRAVALKTIRVGAALDALSRGHLLSTLTREAVMVARFSHPNVVAIYDLEDRGDAAFIAMEFVEGSSLDLVLWRRGRLAAEEVIPLGAGIARALAAAHTRGVVHRDIKPANVLLGKDGAIKVSDFGIADLVAAGKPPGLVIFGTPGYVPPEVLQGASFERGGDLFSLGVVLYYCLTGRRPFDGQGVDDVVRSTLFSRVAPMAGDAVPRELELLILSLLERDPEKRPDDALQVATALDRMAAERGLRWRMPVESAAGHADRDTRAEQGGQWIPTTLFPVRATRPAAGSAARPAAHRYASKERQAASPRRD